jgi:membrane protein DedA with SNARE-associated domain
MIDLSHLAIDSPVSYLIALLLPAFDALIPILPSETAVITLGVATAGSADPRIAILVALAALGAFLGDNLTYFVGERIGPRVDRWLFSGEKGRKRRAWAEHALDRYGARIIVVCRFIPGGRTAVCLTCGLIGFRRRTFVAATAVAGVIWACYAFFIGRLGGQAFEDRPWAGLLLAFGIALAVTGVIELGRRLRVWERLTGRRGGRGGGPGGGRDGPEGDGTGGAGRAASEGASAPGETGPVGQRPAGTAARRGQSGSR